MKSKTATIKYWEQDENLKLLEEWSASGMNLSDIAERMKINRSTLYRWKDKSNLIYDALETGTEEASKKVENSLLKLCCERVIIKKKYSVDSSGNQVLKEVIEEHLPPNVSALVFWLKNRDSKNWNESKSSSEDIKVIMGVPEEYCL